MIEFDFSALPEPGYVHESCGQRYELAASRHHIRRSDGGATFVLTWRTHCACGEAFTVTTGPKANGLIRRCKPHRLKRGGTRGVIPFTGGRLAAPKRTVEIEKAKGGLTDLKAIGGKLMGRYDGSLFKWAPAHGVLLLREDPEVRQALEACEDTLAAFLDML